MKINWKQYTFSQELNVKAWLESKGFEVNKITNEDGSSSLEINSNGIITKADMNDYIVVHTDGSVEALTESEFHEKYKV